MTGESSILPANEIDASSASFGRLALLNGQSSSNSFIFLLICKPSAGLTADHMVYATHKMHRNPMIGCLTNLIPSKSYVLRILCHKILRFVEMLRTFEDVSCPERRFLPEKIIIVLCYSLGSIQLHWMVFSEYYSRNT